MEIIDACTSLKSNLHQSLNKSALFCLDLASQTGSSALMLSCLVNMVGANIINGQILCASKYWNEAYKLLVTTYLVDWISLDAIDNRVDNILLTLSYPNLKAKAVDLNNALASSESMLSFALNPNTLKLTNGTQ